MATQLAFTKRTQPAVTTMSLDAAHVLVAGDKLKLELGDDQELDAVVPEGESWRVHAVFTIGVV